MIRAAVPVKRLQAAKSRLHPALSGAERAGLAERMLRHILGTLAESGMVDATAVVSPDPRALALAAAAGATALPQPGDGLNEALDQARAWAVAAGADTLLVLLGDLPLLTPADIRTMAEIAADPVRGQAVVVLAPDRHGHGTNALLLRPPGRLPFAFGPDSYHRHFQAARAAGAEVMVYRSTGTEFDLDTPGDLAALLGQQQAVDRGQQAVRSAEY